MIFSRNYDLLFDRRGNVLNGAIAQDDLSVEVFDSLQADAVDISALGSGEHKRNMPVIQWNANLEEMFQQEWEKIKSYWDNGGCTLPWEVERVLSADRQKKFETRGTNSRLYWSQGGIGSCMSHASTFAGHSGLLSRIALGDNRIYVPHNPIVTFAISKNGSLRGGQTVSEMAKFANEIGNFPEYLVGENNQAIPANYRSCFEEALDYQWSLAFLTGRNASDLAEQIIMVCKAGFGVAFANSTAVSGATQDGNGIKIAVIRGSWAHATHFVAYRVVDDTEYVGWVNSHGPIYGSSSEDEPADMCWMTRAQLETMCESSFGYGAPYVVIPESIWIPSRQLISDFFVKRPVNFKFQAA